MKVFPLFLATAAAFVAFNSAHADLRAGAAAIDITPTEFPVRINGGIAERLAHQAIDKLHVRCLVLQNGGEPLAIAVVDSCIVPRALLDAAKAKASEATGIPVARMLVSATHCHSAPSVVGAHGTDPEEEYAEFLTGKIAEAVAAAHGRLAPAEAGWGTARCPDYVFCRRWEMKPGTAFTINRDFTGSPGDIAQMNPGKNNPNAVKQTGPADDAVMVLAVREAGGGPPLALLAAYSTHYAGAPQVSADYFGEFCKTMAATWGKANPDFVALMANGTSGDANCIDFTNPDQKFDHKVVAAAVAKAAAEALEGIAFSADPKVAMAEEKLTLGVRMPTVPQVAAAKAFIAETFPDRLPQSWEENYARETVLLSEMPPERELKIQAIRVGDLGIAGMPNEVYGRTGLAIREASPHQGQMNISLANGGEGYLPPPDQFALGGYTTWRARSSCLEEGAEPKVREAVLRLLKKVAE
ncbi:MAG: hypothetical protein R3F11_12035 [Verrucomicrobiales bacterium]